MACGALGLAGAAVAFSGVAPRVQVVLPDPGALLRAQLGFIAACATPPLLGWCVALVWRLRHGAAPSVSFTAVCLGVPLAALLLGFAAHGWLLHQAYAESGDLQPMIAVGDLSPASTGVKLELLAVALLAVVSALRQK